MGCQLNLTREYGRALPGARIVEVLSSAYGSNYNVSVAIGLHGVPAPWVIAGALNGELFRTDLKEALSQSLQPGDMLVLDNLPTHKVAGSGELVAGVRCPSRIPVAVLAGLQLD